MFGCPRSRGNFMRIYGVPRGGLFGWVASPHYLGEILSFVGYAMMSDLLPVWGNALVVSAYLASSANTTLKWYQRECLCESAWVGVGSCRSLTRPRQVLRKEPSWSLWGLIDRACFV